MRADVSSRTLEVFKGVAEETDLTDEALLQAEYLDDGMIDSLELVHFITSLEEEFGIQFEAREMESPRFRTLEGVVSIVEEKVGTEG